MKKIIWGALGMAVGAAIAVAAYWYWTNLRGIGPAINPPPASIADLMETSQTTGATSESVETTATDQTPGQNNTDFPLQVPDGFSVSIYSKDVPSARVMIHSPVQNFLVSGTNDGNIYALPDKNGDGKSNETITVLSGLNKPHGLAMECNEDNTACTLYVAEADGVSTYEYDPLIPAASNPRKIIDIPERGVHYTVTLMVSPPGYEGKLLLSSGSTCNVCIEEDWQRAKILIANKDGSDLREFAKGLRNSVFMTINPVDGNIWATEMGRDFLGDDLPPDEINIIKEGGNYGWPICYGQNIHDTEFDKNTYIRNPCQEPFETLSSIDVPAHSAPLGLAFVPEEGWPEEYWYNLMVAYHGSWNRSAPTGYKVVRYRMDAQGNLLGTEDFITGWLTENNQALGRPVDILTMPGGQMYITDDKAGVVYRVTRRSE